MEKKKSKYEKIECKIKTLQIIAYQNIGNTAIDICIGHSKVLQILSFPDFNYFSSILGLKTASDSMQ